MRESGISFQDNILMGIGQNSSMVLPVKNGNQRANIRASKTTVSVQNTPGNKKPVIRVNTLREEISAINYKNYYFYQGKIINLLRINFFEINELIHFTNYQKFQGMKTVETFKRSLKNSINGSMKLKCCYNRVTIKTHKTLTVLSTSRSVFTYEIMISNPFHETVTLKKILKGRQLITKTNRKFKFQ